MCAGRASATPRGWGRRVPRRPILVAVRFRLSGAIECALAALGRALCLPPSAASFPLLLMGERRMNVQATAPARARAWLRTNAPGQRCLPATAIICVTLGVGSFAQLPVLMQQLSLRRQSVPVQPGRHLLRVGLLCCSSSPLSGSCTFTTSLPFADSDPFGRFAAPVCWLLGLVACCRHGTPSSSGVCSCSVGFAGRSRHCPHLSAWARADSD